MRPARASRFYVLSAALALAGSSLACAGDHARPVAQSPHPYPLLRGSSSEQLPALPAPHPWTEPAPLPAAPDVNEPVSSTETPAAEPPASTPSLPRLRTLDASIIPDGEGCLKQLRQLGVAFQQGPEKRGMKTSVIVTGPLGGVAYRGLYGVPFLCDCRLAVALSWVGPDFLAAGITEVFFSGAYNYRMSRVGRLSLHAWGLAIDVHEVTAKGERLTVTSDYERGLQDPCASKSPLNVVSCRLQARGMFREFLTPDYDADHHDHLHISIKPLGEDPVARKPKPKTGPASETGSATSKRGKRRIKPRQATPAPAATSETLRPRVEKEPAHSDSPPPPTPPERSKDAKRRPKSKHRAPGAAPSEAPADTPEDGTTVPPSPESKGRDEKEPRSKHRTKPEAPGAPPPERPPETPDGKTPDDAKPKEPAPGAASPDEPREPKPERPEQPKPEQPKPEQPKPEQPKPEQPKPEQPPADAPPSK